MRRKLLVLLFIQLIVAALVAFFVVRLLAGPQEPAQAQPAISSAALPPTEIPSEEWQAAARQREEEAKKPPFVGTINGVTLGMGEGLERCTGKRDWHHDWQLVQGTPFEIQPTYLPPGAVEIWYSDPIPPIFTCDGRVDHATRAWSVGGGFRTVIIIKQRNSERRFEGLFPADRVKSATVGGRPAVVVEPMRPDGLMSTTVVFFPEPWGLTIVVGEFLPYPETLKIAEGLR
ncbi:MAG: hypothetical protein NZ695_08645 [Dehalococcoidia bacterium]|jgi:hypothetical protein|nr:hypothetical protein [Dehalococcoidia bacterium]MDW8009763.1 hypothetical protein [Chloroflexota bacterium]